MLAHPSPACLMGSSTVPMVRYGLDLSIIACGRSARLHGRSQQLGQDIGRGRFETADRVTKFFCLNPLPGGLRGGSSAAPAAGPAAARLWRFASNGLARGSSDRLRQLTEVDLFVPYIHSSTRGLNMGRQIDKAARADQVADAALALFLDNPRDAVTFEAIAERAGLNYWQVYRFHGNARTLFRAAVSRLVKRIETGLRAAPAEAPSVSEGVRRYTNFAAAIMQDEAYAQFAYLLIRDRCVEPMLEEAYDGRILRTLRSGLEKIVRN